ncbi:PREDICTED: putative Dol-P-Glc:Glc(2)Man(9)GlcNAc(2)-PP-Dol alpha-1,2-glucosyltransferase [Ceratosolen solmsi marchali]|uniref:Dol-P-Glc:Glc(2)Man(9)GlcNAc(2)-PP-Dol alpha-1,2-glucosyltransferase n=1 Tax=Ceratosolen solmsi marchali TaxID=326594 RepID=A0AAJ7E231_9HYME|nr:PREDICTED: putative Dol-P-Glc:Glc(2)Man(9)GlcNAc(2)-PP-Dol alpha-1,2-glucosyltransferase [Ceratosolen solmsi marchali]
MRAGQVATQYKEKIFYKIPDNFMNAFIKILTFGSATFSLILILLFYYLNSFQSHYYIDEKFHVPQALRFCEGEFYEWDSKITTLPGLYLFSAFLLGPLNLCTITNLRLINVLCTYLNLFLSFQIIKCLNGRSKARTDNNLRRYKLYLIAWNITFFPPLFFWFFLYYTDIFSLNLILIMLLFHLYDKHKTAAFLGILSICVRQTNVAWVAFLGIDKCLTIIDQITNKPRFTDTLNVLPCLRTLYKIFKAEKKRGTLHFLKFLQSTCKDIFPYTLALTSFIIFIIYNKGIVVGDRTAHVPTFHLTQIFYFSLFVLCFSWPYLLPYLAKFVKQVIYKNLISISLLSFFLVLIIHCNTLVHPYILADNRHYSFYVWKNLMSRFAIFKYTLVPVYAFAMYAIFKSLNHLRLLSFVAYILCTCIVLVPQLLLEPRYFIIPYILCRVYQKEPNNWQIVAETLTTIFINIAQFVLFINKTFYWEDEKYPQRIGW